jgi:hypothetical protein
VQKGQEFVCFSPSNPTDTSAGSMNSTSIRDPLQMLLSLIASERFRGRVLNVSSGRQDIAYAMNLFALSLSDCCGPFIAFRRSQELKDSSFVASLHPILARIIKRINASVPFTMRDAMRCVACRIMCF